jgi:hypothetical protein
MDVCATPHHIFILAVPLPENCPQHHSESVVFGEIGGVIFQCGLISAKSG